VVKTAHQRGANRLAVALLLVSTALGMAAPAPEPIPNDKCLECHSDKDLTTQTDVGVERSVYVDAAVLAGSIHATNTCASCHADIAWEHPDDQVKPKPVRCEACHERQALSYGLSVHGQAAEAGDPAAPTCGDCHHHHDVLPSTDPRSRLHFSRQAATCGDCHPAEAEDVAASVHGKAAMRGVREAPTCTDCHMEHSIRALTGTDGQRVAEQVCSKCHASERLNTKFGLPADRVQTFFESYHGLAIQGGSASAANCASCHGYHRILPSTDPESSVHPAHLMETCGKCHPGISEGFALGSVHSTGTPEGNLGEQVNWWVRRLYLLLIFAVVGGLGVHNLLSLMRSALLARSLRGPTVLRMDRHQRAQHFILLTSFILLALSGFALKYPDTWVAWLFAGDESVRRWVHRVAGVVLIGLGCWHVVYVAFFREGRRLAKDLWFRTRDARDIVLNLRYLTGRTSERPRFARFGYVEKFEYWAVVWGTVIMGVTGLAIWLKVDVTQFLPRWVVEVATTIHYYEAILACLAIVVWHFYHVIFAPGTYPMNWAWWDGRVSEEWHQEEHPLEHVPEAPPKPVDVDRARGEGI
jgi:formate dehydrogenase gamma subunit